MRGFTVGQHKAAAGCVIIRGKWHLSRCKHYALTGTQKELERGIYTKTQADEGRARGEKNRETLKALHPPVEGDGDTKASSLVMCS